MTYIPNNGALVPSFVLSADWANAGTITLSYPSGFNQGSFLDGLAVPNKSFVMKNRADKIFEDVTGASGIQFSFGSSNITVTNNTGATIVAGTRLDFWLDQQDGNNVLELSFPVYAMSGVSAADVVTSFRPGVDGYIEDVQWVQGAPVTTGSKLATITPKINSTSTTGGALALTSAACTPLGKVIAASQITANNRITKKDTLSLTASSVTAFVEGSGTIIVRIRLDTL